MKIKSTLERFNPLFYLSLLLLSFFCVVSFYLSFVATASQQQYSLLAESFLNGKLYFSDSLNLIEDAVYYDNHFYWPLGPFPALVLMPFTFVFSLLNLAFYQGYLQFFLNVTVFWLCYNLARKLNWGKIDSFFLAFAFLLASVYQILVMMPWSWYLVQVICTLLLLICVHEYLGQRRYLLIGILLGFVFMSRFTAGFAILFFTILLITDKKEKNKFQKLLQMYIPVAVSGILLLIYNQLRFGNMLENGYQLTNNLLLNDSQRYELLEHGLFKLRNIPTNFYYYFIKTLDPVLVNKVSLFGNTHYLEKPFVTLRFPGTSFFVVSPVFLYIFKSRLKEKIPTAALVVILFTLPFLLTYYWSGWRQVGPRYMIDLLPFFYLLLLYSFKDFSLGMFVKVLIIVSSILNFYLFITVFNG